MKRLHDFRPYESILPYASEIFGVYQPLIGWTSKRQKERLKRGFRNDLKQLNRSILARFAADIEVRLIEDGRLAEIERVGIASLPAWRRRTTGTFLGDWIAAELPPLEEYDDAQWDVIQPDRLREIIDREVTAEVDQWQRGQLASGRAPDPALRVAEQLARESAIAGLLVHLKEAKQFDTLKDLFYKQDLDLQKLLRLTTFRDPLDYFDPQHDIDRAGLSPIGIVHLFRQYFFEFDTFLGTPVGHVWLSPGSLVELVEVSTRKTIIEKTLEQAIETTTKAEKSTTTEEEIADAVKEENRSDTKFGMSVTVNQGWITGSATASSSIGLDSTQSKAREHTHRQMRRQTEKLSTEIRRNFKSTFRTVTETTDTSSKRYVLNNTTDELVNYELRRKMRQVGVQVQDVGTYLCWQAYVDDPGRNLGIAKLVHIAKDPELGAIPPPESVPKPGPHATEMNIDIPFVPSTEDTEPDEDMDEAYRDGIEVNLDTADGTPEMIQWVFGGLRNAADIAGYEFESIAFDYGEQDVVCEATNIDTSVTGEVAFSIMVRHINFRNVPTVRIIAKITWQPTDKLREEVEAQNKKNVAAFNEATAREHQKAYLVAARDRINNASRVDQRPFDELREEERIVVYRALIQDMLTRGVPMKDDRTRHVVSELLNTIFDIDKMLYFVAPEWWRPRRHRSHQGFGPPPKPGAGRAASVGGASGAPAGTSSSVVGPLVYTLVREAKLRGTVNGATLAKLDKAKREDDSIPSTSLSTWGGTGENRADNYYITEDSAPASMGASLGWLLQLDGDNLRNAFLNAPWVKAVIPIRPGKERAAINWLRQTHVEGADGLDDLYVAPADELDDIPHEGEAPTVLDAIVHLCAKVAEKHAKSQQVQQFPPEEINDDNKVTATPIDKVYEHGFYPLQDGFRVQPEGSFEVFDQWVEVLPTDQVVPVEVAYDPKTGRQL